MPRFSLVSCHKGLFAWNLLLAADKVKWRNGWNRDCCLELMWRVMAEICLKKQPLLKLPPKFSGCWVNLYPYIWTSWELGGFWLNFFNSSQNVCVPCRFMPIFESLSWKTQDLGQLCYSDKNSWAKFSDLNWGHHTALLFWILNHPKVHANFWVPKLKNKGFGALLWFWQN